LTNIRFTVILVKSINKYGKSRRDDNMKLTTKELLITALFTALMAAGAFIRIPFPLLPVTLQTFICALAGMVLGPRLGAISMAVYTLLGLAGVPIFAKGGGIAYVFDTSFGFILGFIACAAVVGMISSKTKKPSFLNNLKALVPGLIVTYAIGISYMLLIMRVYMGNEQAGLIFLLGANLPYIIKDIVLYIIIAAAGVSMIPAVRKALPGTAPKQA
jgi:biotin transport system substrate-specific component